MADTYMKKGRWCFLFRAEVCDMHLMTGALLQGKRGLSMAGSDVSTSARQIIHMTISHRFHRTWPPQYHEIKRLDYKHGD
jgi:hypothetical protein